MLSLDLSMNLLAANHCSQFKPAHHIQHSAAAVPGLCKFDQRNKRRQTLCRTAPLNSTEIAQTGDTATIHFTAYGEQGERLESTRDAGQALNFEVGSSTAVGNELLGIFDKGILGMRVGQSTSHS